MWIHNRRLESWRGRVPGRFALAALAALVAAAVPVASALAATSGSVSETITVSVRSVTVSPSSASMCSSASPLTFPNGNCQSTGITVTNGPVAGHIDVSGADAVPSDNGTNWTLCGGAGPTCTGTSSAPGQDQYQQATYNGASGGNSLTDTPQCDTAFNLSCSASAGSSDTETINMRGPSASTDPSSTFTSTVTWTAVP